MTTEPSIVAGEVIASSDNLNVLTEVEVERFNGLIEAVFQLADTAEDAETRLCAIRVILRGQPETALAISKQLPGNEGFDLLPLALLITDATAAMIEIPA